MGVDELEKLTRAAEADADDPEKWHKLGRYAVERYILGASERALVNAARLAPNNPEILSDLGKVLNRKRFLTEAEGVYRLALGIDRSIPSLWTGLGVVKGHQMDAETSVSCYEQALDIDAGYPWAISSLVATLQQVKPQIDILDRLRTAVATRPNEGLNWALLWKELRKRGQTSEAAKALDRALLLFEKANPDNQRRMVLILSNSDKKEEIFKTAETILKEDPAQIGVAFALATVYIKERSEEKAERLVESSLRVDPGNQMLQNLRMVLLMETGNMAEALRMQKAMQEERPEDPLMRVTDSLLAHARGGTAETVESMMQILNRFPQDAGVRIALVQKLSAEQRFNEAVKILRSGHRMSYPSPEQHFQYAVEALRFGLREEADFHMRVGLEMDGSSLHAKSMLAVHLASSDRFEELENVTREIVRDYPDDARDWHMILGMLERMKGNREKAKDSIALAADAGVPHAIVELAELLHNSGDTNRAMSLLKNLVHQLGETLPAVKARALIMLNSLDSAENLLKNAVKTAPLDMECWALYITLIGRLGDRNKVKAVVEEFHTAAAPFISNHSVVDPLQDVDEILTGQFEGHILDEVTLMGAIDYLAKKHQPKRG